MDHHHHWNSCSDTIRYDTHNIIYPCCFTLLTPTTATPILTNQTCLFSLSLFSYKLGRELSKRGEWRAKEEEECFINSFFSGVHAHIICTCVLRGYRKKEKEFSVHSLFLSFLFFSFLLFVAVCIRGVKWSNRSKGREMREGWLSTSERGILAFAFHSWLWMDLFYYYYNSNNSSWNRTN